MKPMLVCFAILWLGAPMLAGHTFEPTPESKSLPYPTGSYLQRVRKFFTSADGLPGDDIQALTVTREGVAFAAASNQLARLQGERWNLESAPADVTALFASRQGPNALAGSTNGVWWLDHNTWNLEEHSPEGVISFAAEPDGVVWAMAPTGLWRRETKWTLIN